MTTRAAILQAADQLFGEHGFDATTTRQIAEHSGANKALIHYHFENKDQLFHAVLDRHCGELSEVLAIVAGREGTLRERLGLLVEAYVDFLAGHLGFSRMIQREVSSGRHVGRIVDHMLPPFQAALTLLEAVWPATRSGDMSAPHLLLSFFGMVSGWFAYAPVVEPLTGLDPLAPESLAQRKRHLLGMLDLLLVELDTGSPPCRGGIAGLQSPVIRGVLFDKDGTLVDFEATWRPVYRACALSAAAGAPALARALMQLAGQDRDGRIDPTSPLGCGTLHEIWATWRPRVALDVPALDRLAAETAVPIALVPLGPVFERLRGLRLGMATMDTTASALEAARLLGLDLDFVTGCDGGHGTKPGPGMVLGFCAATSLEPHEVAVVGDTPHDLHAARAAGALAVAVSSGASPRALLARHADHVLDSVVDLPDLLGR